MESRTRGYTIVTSGGPLELTKGTYIALMKKKPIAKVYDLNIEKIIKSKGVCNSCRKNNLNIGSISPRKKRQRGRAKLIKAYPIINDFDIYQCK